MGILGPFNRILAEKFVSNVVLMRGVVDSPSAGDVSCDDEAMSNQQLCNADAHIANRQQANLWLRFGWIRHVYRY